MPANPRILAHRGNIDGPSSAENTLVALRQALERGWDIETDIRRGADGRFYISHDPAEPPYGLPVDAFCALVRSFPQALVALNVKEDGHEAALVACLEAEGIIGQVFLFDMELGERVAGSAAARMRALNPRVRLAARASDRGEPIARALRVDAASIVWLDEFDGPWCTRTDLQLLKNAGRTVYAVSPELHGRPLDRARARWRVLVEWGIDGICTDYPAALHEMLAGGAQGAAA